MKNIVLLSLALLCCCLSIKAQDNNELDVVYLHSGTIIQGLIVEEVPYDYLKIQLGDGSIFNLRMNDIAKITKPLNPIRQVSTESELTSSPLFSVKKGYKGFVDLGYSIGAGELYNRIDRLEFSTSHGYQFNQYLYAGLGAGLTYFHYPEYLSVPLFANVRTGLPTGAISPFLDLKIGYTVGDEVEGFYLSPSLGLRFDLQRNKAMNLSLGYTLQKTDVYYTDYNGRLSIDKANIGAITFKAGFEF